MNVAVPSGTARYAVGALALAALAVSVPAKSEVEVGWTFLSRL